jgi:hypothetical protein
VAGPDLAAGRRAGLLGVAAGEALALPWVGVPPRRISRRRLLDDVGPTGPITAALSEQSPNARGQSPLMGALVIGWDVGEVGARRSAALELGVGAVVVADLAAALIAGRPVHHLVADHGDDWPPPFHGIGADDRSVIDALLAVLHRHDDPTEGMRAAVRLGGDGAAVLTALVGGLLGARRPTAIDRVPWPFDTPS